MTNVNGLERARREGTLLGIPLGELGWFQTLLISFATGFAAFFATTFVGIMSLLLYSTVTGRHVDFALSYKRFGLPVGVVVLALSLGFLGTLWARRKVRKG
jgi:hypothetical protein